MTLLVFLVLFFLSPKVSAIDTLRLDSLTVYTNIEVLPDNNYTIQDIAQDSNLTFTIIEGLDPQKSDSYWLKITLYNPSNYSELYNLRIFPSFDNILYYYDYDKNEWLATRFGLFSGEKARNVDIVPCLFRANSEHTLFIKVGLADIKTAKWHLKPRVFIQNAATLLAKESSVYTQWIVLVSVLILFMLYNMGIYLYLKDNTYLYYLITLLGGLFYATTLGKFTILLFGRFFCKVQLVSADGFYYYDSNLLFHSIAIGIVVYGMTYLTRSYLQTSSLYPKIDRILRYYLFYTLINIALLSGAKLVGVLPLNAIWAINYENSLFVILVLFILYISVKSHRDKNKTAIYFLIANLLPLLLMLILAVFFILYPTSLDSILFLPPIMIMGYALTFSVALIERVTILKDDLKQKELEAAQLQSKNKEIALNNKLIETEHKKILADIELEKAKNENLELKLEMNSRELISSTLYITQKNEMLEDLKNQVTKLSTSENGQNNELIREIKSIIHSNLILDSSWETFKVHFEQVHPDFFRDLQEKHPNLTQHEVRLSAYLHINLSTKEIAALLNIDPASVRKAKMRLNKKLNLLDDSE